MDPAQTAPAPVPTPTQPGTVTSTEIPISEAKKLEHGGAKKNKKLIIVIALLLIFFVLAFVGILFLRKPAPAPKAPPKPTPTPTKVVSTVLPIDTAKTDKVLVSGVPHFFNLLPTDLPNVYDIRAIFNYKSNLIIVSASGIIEFNPKTNDIIRQSDPRLFSCINYATMIGSKLYVTCNGSPNRANQPKGVYVINVDTGKLEKVYTEGSADLSYVTVTNEKDTLWVGAKNEVVKINTKDDTMKEYFPDDLGMPNCQYFMVHTYNKTLWATCVPNGNPSVSIYNNKENKWNPYTPSNGETNPIYTLGYTPDTLYFLSYTKNPTLYTYDTTTNSWESTPSATLQIPSSGPIANDMRKQLQNGVIFPGIEQKGVAYLSYYDTVEKKVKDFELVLSDYLGISDIVNEKRYLFTKNAVDTVKNNEFPKSFKKLSKPIGNGTKLYVDPFETYAVLIGSASASTPPFTAELVELKKGHVTNLLENNESIQKASPEALSKFATSLEKVTLNGTSKEAEIVDRATGDPIIEIDFATKALTFYE